MGKHVGLDFSEKHGTELQEFYHEALLHGYGAADGDVTKTEYDDGSTKIVYKRGVWRYSDKFFGGEPFAGMSVVRYDSIACFVMNYWGKVLPFADKEEIYRCLMPALLATNKDHPWRGPNHFLSEDGLRYTNIWHGNINKFYGQEKIGNANDDWLYEADYRGGIVNLE